VGSHAHPLVSRRRVVARLAVAPLSALGIMTVSQRFPALAQDASPAAGTPGPLRTDRPFAISAIPDQDVSVLNRQFGAMADYLSEATGLAVEYVPMVDYASLITAFERGDIQLAWFGGLTGVQAQAIVPGTEAIAQRPRDAEFHSKFIVRAGLDDVTELADLKGLSFTFGSESSTSGHLMPRYFLTEAGIDPEHDFRGLPNYSGSHDKTIALVESGAFDAGALNEAVWEARLRDGKVDTTKVREFYTSPAFFDYHWGIRPDVDEVYGAGATERITAAILGMDATVPEQKAILDLAQTEKYIPTTNANYDTIRAVAEELGILRP
jgi:phosphonate transport system substrate-binding protein